MHRRWALRIVVGPDLSRLGRARRHEALLGPLPRCLTLRLVVRGDERGSCLHTENAVYDAQSINDQTRARCGY